LLACTRPAQYQIVSVNSRQPPPRRPAPRPPQGARRPAPARRRPSSSAIPNNAAKWFPVAAGGALLAVVIAAGVAFGGGSDSADPTTPVTGVSSVPTSLAPTTVTYDAVATTPTTAPVDKIPLTRTLANGVVGDDVERVQQRLKDLAFDPGPVDGVYGPKTIQAVWAYEKLVEGVPRADATGRVTPELWDGMQNPITIVPRRSNSTSRHVEIYLPQQVLVVFHDNSPVLIAHISSGELDASGNPAHYCDEAIYDTDINGQPLDPPVAGTACAYAKTPGGIFTIDRMEQGKHTSPLGGMYDPVYFNYGVAIHGANEIPLHPASHGCIRIYRFISDYFQSLVGRRDQVIVWDGIKEPEQQTKNDRLPSFNEFTPDSTTTTSTTTTTTTTIAPTTTVGPTTTKPPVTTTTTTTTPTTSSTSTTLPPVGP
jgi:peptidoglycan hydrolase-like protein with peptidoglycan-binding domain